MIAGTKIGRYEIRSKIGEGGMGVVYLAHDTELDRPVAMKVLAAEVAADPRRMRRFIQEAKATSALNHPHILTIHEIGISGATHFIATEFIEGETLRQWMSRELTLAEILEAAIQTAGALAAAHAAGVVHRDIKPENIMIRRDGYIKVLDFGLAKLIEPRGSTTDNEAPTKANITTGIGTVMGTPNYMSPEQARGTVVDERTDLWSLGVLLYEMVTGRVPFAGESAAETVSLILQKEPAPLTRYSHEVPAELERIVSKAVTKNREERYQSARDLLVDLRHLKGKLAVEAELDRSGSIEPRHVDSAGGSPDAVGTVPATVAATALETATPAASRAHYVVAGIKQHKLAAVVALLMLVVVGGGLTLSRYWRKSETAIESIAVLPFQNRNTETDTEYLSEGLAESLIYRLSRLPNLRVSPTSSVFRYGGKEIDPVKVGQELDVNAVLSGRIVQYGDNLTISAELVDVRNNRLLWGEQYERKSSDLLATQREIAREIVETLKLKVSGEPGGPAKHFTESNEAYQLYLKGRFYWNKRNGEAIRKSIEYFNQAIEKDPGFALAYAGLADSYVVPANRLPPREAMPKAKAAAMRALELDDTLAEAHTSLARVFAAYEWDRPAAEKEYKRAIELNPRYPPAHEWYGGWFEAMGRNSEALAEKKRALELDPLSLVINFDMGLAFYYGRDYDQAIAQFQKTLELDQNFLPVQQFLPAAYEQKLMYDRSIAGYKNLIALQGGSEWAFSLAGLGHAYAVSGKKSEARALLDELKQLSAQQYVPAPSLALIYAGLDEKDQAFAWLEKGYEERAFQMSWLKVEPRWDSLRADPRFANLTRRMGLQ